MKAATAAVLSLLALLAPIGATCAATAVPTGPLPQRVKPTAYRLSLTIDPSAQRFSGHTEIDAVLTQPARSLYLHGRELRVTKAQVSAGKSMVTARYSEVDDSGVARLDLPVELPAGKVTLRFDYTAAFRTGAEGLFHGKVGADWYAWTQMEPIDARRMFPGFDEPGFKTPFTLTVTAPKAARVFANAPELSATAAGASTVHRFAPTPPLPTYLVALGVGPFEVVETRVAPNALRAQPLALRVIATRGQQARMQFAAAEAPRLLDLLEQYLGSAYPYAKLDLMASPIQGGAMENAGLILFSDDIILLDANAPLRQLRGFGDTVAHEMAHQWFGDLVTPTWWTDIWLNESFAEWLGRKIGHQWRPELGIAITELDAALDAMDTDSLDSGRPIRQVITENRQVASAFDDITYEKGAQVLSMFENYLGPATFARGVQQHLARYRHGNASAADFFASIGAAAGNAQVVPALQTFIDQTGVPVIRVVEGPQGVGLSQSRYRPLGVASTAAQTWQIPVCLSRDANRACALLDSATLRVESPAGTGPLMPNAGGTGYYRFSLDAAGWDRLIAAVATLPGREALATADSLWADFAAGSGRFEQVVAGARALSQNPERLAALALAYRLKELADTALTAAQLPAYRNLMQSIYAPRLAALGVDLRPGAHADEPAQRRALRQSLLPIVALEGRDPALRARLASAAAALLGGDAAALDPAFRAVALRVAVQERGAPFIQQLGAALIASTDPLFRQDASAAIGSGDTPALAEAGLAFAMSPGMQPLDRMRVAFAVAGQPETREVLARFADRHFQALAESLPGFARPRVIGLFDGYCAPADVARIDAFVKPRLQALGGGELELAQTLGRIERCAALKSAKGAEIAAALAQ